MNIYKLLNNIYILTFVLWIKQYAAVNVRDEPNTGTANAHIDPDTSRCVCTSLLTS